jgi:hypothetical protein
MRKTNPEVTQPSAVPAGQANSPITISIPVNEHRARLSVGLVNLGRDATGLEVGDC